jgi:hypothetical protein
MRPRSRNGSKRPLKRPELGHQATGHRRPSAVAMRRSRRLRGAPSPLSGGLARLPRKRNRILGSRVRRTSRCRSHVRGGARCAHLPEVCDRSWSVSSRVRPIASSAACGGGRSRGSGGFKRLAGSERSHGSGDRRLHDPAMQQSATHDETTPSRSRQQAASRAASCGFRSKESSGGTTPGVIAVCVVSLRKSGAAVQRRAQIGSGLGAWNRRGET